MKPTRPALRYHGGKWRIAPWIIRHLPLDHTCYVEPFAGGGSILLRKDPARFEVLNDIDGEIVNFFDVLRNQTAELLRQIQLTPFSRAEAIRAFEESGGTPMQRARRIFIRSWQSMGGPRTQRRSGWRFSVGATGAARSAVEEWGNNAHLYAVAERLKAVQLESDDAMKIIPRFDAKATLFYLDPPYLAETRSRSWRRHAYTNEMGEAGHVALAELLNGIQGMAVLSGYPSQLYEDLYEARGWAVVKREAVTDKAARRTECLWINPAAVRGLETPNSFRFGAAS